MKKIILIIIAILLFTGCDREMTSPTKKVEEALNNYQNLDNSIDYDLNRIIDKEKNLSDDDRKSFRNALERQFQNLSYKIKDEEINDDNATVEVEIEVLDYKSSYDKSRKYFLDNKEEFTKDEVDESKLEELAEYITYKIKELTNVEDKVKYDVTFNLTKEDNEWVIDNIDDESLEKLLGLY